MKILSSFGEICLGKKSEMRLKAKNESVTEINKEHFMESRRSRHVAVV